jgi:hypothetical protein
MLKHKVQIALICGLDDFMQFDNIFMLHLMKKRNFTVGSLGISGVLKGVKYFFKGLNLLGLFISDFPYMTVGATAEEFFGFVELKHMGFDVFGHEKKESEFKIEIEGNKINSKL